MDLVRRHILGFAHMMQVVDIREILRIHMSE
jgi:hypothetical protein